MYKKTFSFRLTMTFCYRRHILVAFFCLVLFVTSQVNCEGKNKTDGESCMIGYTKSRNGTCIDINECMEELKTPCPASTPYCMNNEGSFTCRRHCSFPRYQQRYINGRIVCNDINECHFVYCGKNKECINTVGGYKCKIARCDKGFVLKDGHCHDLDECQNKSICGKGKCFNYYGSYHCFCGVGYKRDSKTGKCVDQDECSSTFKQCVHECINTEGSYKCKCPPGYTSRDRNCQDIDECINDQHNCTGVGETCSNTRGSFKCLKCQCPNKFLTRTALNVCRKIRCPLGDEECRVSKTYIVKWRQYAFEKTMHAGSFSFQYSITGYSHRYRIIFSLAEGNYKDSFETRQLSPTQILIRNNNDITGPRDLKLVLHSDVVDYENRIVDRFVYNLIFNLGEYEF